MGKKEGIGMIVTGATLLSLPAVCISVVGAFSNVATHLSTLKAEALTARLLAEGQRAKLLAEASIFNQAALAVEADRLTAHAALYATTPNLQPLVWLLAVIIAALVVFDVYMLWRLTKGASSVA